MKVSYSNPFLVKYPNLNEVQQQGLNPIQLNHHVDVILDTVLDHGSNRMIYFSSFHPDVCWMLICKQSKYPVLLLTGKNIIRFVRGWY